METAIFRRTQGRSPTGWAVFDAKPRIADYDPEQVSLTCARKGLQYIAFPGLDGQGGSRRLAPKSSWTVTTATAPRCGPPATPDGPEFTATAQRTLPGFRRAEGREIFLALLGKQYAVTSEGFGRAAAGEFGKAGHAPVGSPTIRRRSGRVRSRKSGLTKKKMKAAKSAESKINRKAAT